MRTAKRSWFRPVSGRWPAVSGPGQLPGGRGLQVSNGQLTRGGDSSDQINATFHRRQVIGQQDRDGLLHPDDAGRWGICLWPSGHRHRSSRSGSGPRLLQRLSFRPRHHRWPRLLQTPVDGVCPVQALSSLPIRKSLRPMMGIRRHQGDAGEMMAIGSGIAGHQFQASHGGMGADQEIRQGAFTGAACPAIG